ncbi:unnamed protein product [Polarella glacialis]|uniref:Ice-binding protein n=1 Tax=Polarella glacialis TaxID=89957 RepID=A0A813JUW0_POLGL|nr:unnamed protein product [Polarella glacialis]
MTRCSFTIMTKIVLIAALGAIASVSAQSVRRRSRPMPAALELGTAGCYSILSSLAISTLPDQLGLTSAIKGDMGVSTISNVGGITGFSLTDDSTKTFATSLLVEGRVYDADYAAPTPTLLTVAAGAMGIAYTDAVDRPPPYQQGLVRSDDTDLPADFGRYSSQTGGGTFKYLSSVNITSDFTMSGSPTDICIFLIARELIVAKNAQITLFGGALASNIFWQVGGLVHVGIGAHMEGIILANLSVDFLNGSSLNGRILSQATVNLQSATVQSVPDTTSTTSCTTLESQTWCDTLDRSLLDKSSRRFCTKELRQSLSSLWKSHLAHPTAKSDQVHGPHLQVLYRWKEASTQHLCCSCRATSSLSWRHYTVGVSPELPESGSDDNARCSVQSP